MVRFKVDKTGGLIVWKKARVYDPSADMYAETTKVLIKLRVPPTAKVRFRGTKFDRLGTSMLTSVRVAAKYRVEGKCRAEQATPLAFYEFTAPKRTKGKYKLRKLRLKANQSVRSLYDSTYEYRLDKVARPKGKRFGRDKFETCAAGIHFFATRAQAAAFRL